MWEPHYQETMQQKHMYLLVHQGLKTQIHLRHCLCTQGASSSKFLTNFWVLKKGQLPQWWHFTPTRMWRNWNPRPSLVGMQNGTATLEKVWHFLKRLNIRVSIWPSNSTLRHILKRNENTCPDTNSYTTVHGGIICNSPQRETTWMDTQNVVYIHTMVYFFTIKRNEVLVLQHK